MTILESFYLYCAMCSVYMCVIAYSGVGAFTRTCVMEAWSSVDELLISLLGGLCWPSSTTQQRFIQEVGWMFLVPQIVFMSGGSGSPSPCNYCCCVILFTPFDSICYFNAGLGNRFSSFIFLNMLNDHLTICLIPYDHQLDKCCTT